MVEDLIVKTTEASHPTSRLTPVISRTEPSADQEVHSQVTEATGLHLQPEVLTTTTHAATLIAVVVTLQAHAATQATQTAQAVLHALTQAQAQAHQ